MKQMSKLALAAVASIALSAPAIAQEKLRMATIAPGSSAYLVMTTMASAVNDAQDDVRTFPCLIPCPRRLAHSLFFRNKRSSGLLFGAI